MQKKQFTDFALLTQSARGANTHGLSTSDTIAHIMKDLDGYLSRFASMGIRKNDTVRITANYYGDGELADVMVTSVDKNRVTARVLNGGQR
jgi:hypothetical protein